MVARDIAMFISVKKKKKRLKHAKHNNSSKALRYYTTVYITQFSCWCYEGGVVPISTVPGTCNNSVQHPSFQ